MMILKKSLYKVIGKDYEDENSEFAEFTKKEEPKDSDKSEKEDESKESESKESESKEKQKETPKEEKKAPELNEVEEEDDFFKSLREDN